MNSIAGVACDGNQASSQLACCCCRGPPGGQHSVNQSTNTKSSRQICSLLVDRGIWGGQRHLAVAAEGSSPALVSITVIACHGTCIALQQQHLQLKLPATVSCSGLRAQPIFYGITGQRQQH